MVQSVHWAPQGHDMLLLRGTAVPLTEAGPAGSASSAPWRERSGAPAQLYVEIKLSPLPE